MKLKVESLIRNGKTTGVALAGAMAAHAVTRVAEQKLPSNIGRFAPEMVLAASIIGGALSDNKHIQVAAAGAGVVAGIKTVNKYLPAALKAGAIGNFIPSLNGTDEPLYLLEGTQQLYATSDADYELLENQSLLAAGTEFAGIEGLEGGISLAGLQGAEELLQ